MIREETLTAKQDLEAAQKKLEAPASKAGSNLEVEASQVHLKTLEHSRVAELKMLDVEAISNPSRVELLKAGFRLLDIQKMPLSPFLPQ